MSERFVGGWHLTLTCHCGATGEFDAVVPGIAWDRARAAGWEVDGRQIKIHEIREATCATCHT